jgi:hypothetical protein
MGLRGGVAFYASTLAGQLGPETVDSGILSSTPLTFGSSSAPLFTLSSATTLPLTFLPLSLPAISSSLAPPSHITPSTLFHTSTSMGFSSQNSTGRATASSSSNLAIVISSTVGGVAFIFTLLVITTLVCRCVHSARVVKIDPLTASQASFTIRDKFGKVPHSAGSSCPFLARLSFDLGTESATTGATLTDETLPIPSEVDDIYCQLEALSAEVRSLQCTEEQPERERDSPTRALQTSIDQLRMDVQRLRCHNPTPTTRLSSTGAEGVLIDPSSMPGGLALLQTEIEELLIKQMHLDTVQFERLPIHHSRKVLASYSGYLQHLPHLPPTPGRFEKC